MGSCQNCGPFLGTLNNRCRIIIGTPQRDHNFDNHPYIIYQQQDEAKLAMELKHPFIVETISWFQTYQEEAYTGSHIHKQEVGIEMELADATLEGWVVERNALDGCELSETWKAQCKIFTLQNAKALQDLHDSALVHRDIMPSMHIYIYIHTYIHTYIHMHIYIYIHVIVYI